MRVATSGPCTPSTTPARTVISSSLLRRHRIGSSSSKCRGASWARDTTPPSPVPPAQQGLQGVAEGRRIDAERARLVLVDFEPHCLGELIPVEVDVARGG